MPERRRGCEFSARAASLEWMKGSPRSFTSSPGVVRSTSIGSLEAPEQVTPDDHTGTLDAPPWDRPADGLQQYLRTRSEG